MLDNLMVVLIEHQTTINPNMPLRFLSYVDELYRRYVQSQQKRIYSSELIPLPAPNFYVFYDGDNTSFDHATLKLSDAFLTESSQLELTVNVYNLAEGKSKRLKDACRPLHEYSIFSNKYKYFRKRNLSIDESIRETIAYCLKNNIMSEYLKNNEREVIDMFGFEWNEKEEREALLEAGERRGEARSEARGEARGKIFSIKNLMKNMNLSAEDAMNAIGIAPSEYKQYMAML